MKRHFFSTALTLCLAGSALFLASCATPENRIAKNPALYNSLSAEDRALVSQGKIRNGMTRDGVFLAWGNPDQRTTASVNGRPAETWVYSASTATNRYYGYPYGAYPFYSPGFAYSHRHRSGFRHGHYAYDPFYDPFFWRGPEIVRYADRTVSFQNGRVVAFQFLTPPRVY